MRWKRGTRASPIKADRDNPSSSGPHKPGTRIAPFLQFAGFLIFIFATGVVVANDLALLFGIDATQSKAQEWRVALGGVLVVVWGCWAWEAARKA